MSRDLIVLHCASDTVAGQERSPNYELCAGCGGISSCSGVAIFRPCIRNYNWGGVVCSRLGMQPGLAGATVTVVGQTVQPTVSSAPSTSPVPTVSTAPTPYFGAADVNNLAGGASEHASSMSAAYDGTSSAVTSMPAKTSPSAPCTCASARGPARRGSGSAPSARAADRRRGDISRNRPCAPRRSPARPAIPVADLGGRRVLAPAWRHAVDRDAVAAGGTTGSTSTPETRTTRTVRRAAARRPSSSSSSPSAAPTSAPARRRRRRRRRRRAADAVAVAVADDVAGRRANAAANNVNVSNAVADNVSNMSPTTLTYIDNLGGGSSRHHTMSASDPITSSLSSRGAGLAAWGCFRFRVLSDDHDTAGIERRGRHVPFRGLTVH